MLSPFGSRCAITFPKTVGPLWVAATLIPSTSLSFIPLISRYVNISFSCLIKLLYLPLVFPSLFFPVSQKAKNNLHRPSAHPLPGFDCSWTSRCETIILLRYLCVSYPNTSSWYSRPLRFLLDPLPLPDIVYRYLHSISWLQVRRRKQIDVYGVHRRLI